MADPIALFKALLEKEKETNDFATAMTLATVSPETLMPRTRTVLLRRITGSGELEFFTNYNSVKAQNLDENPQASVCFFWPESYYQVIIEGAVHKNSRSTTETYFASRSKAKQMASFASNQSQPIDSFDLFLAEFEKTKVKFEGQDVPCPAHWGGYHIVPKRIEIWKGSHERLHERHEFTLRDGVWTEQILSP